MDRGRGLIDERALEPFLEERLGPAGGIEVEPIEGGNANETFAVTWGERDLVLRRPPIEPAVPGLLHGLLREAEVLSALSSTRIPTPEIMAVCTDEDVIGSAFYIMERLRGEIVAGEEPERFATPEYRHRIGEETIDVLAKIHGVDHDHAGLSHLDSGRNPEEEVAALSDRLEWAEEVTGDVRTVERLHGAGEWLSENAPATDRRTLVHGDYKPDNIMWAPGTPPRIVGVLDWELCGLGDPLTDLGWFLSYWHEPRDPSPLTDRLRERYADHELFPFLEEFAEGYSRFMQRPGYPSRRDLVERYEARMELEFTDDRFYRALGVYKLGVICEGFFRRYVEGSESAKDTYPIMELVVPLLAEQATRIIHGAIPL